MAPHDVSTLKTALKMRQFSRASWFEPKHTIESIQDQPLEHHLINIQIVLHNNHALVWIGTIDVVNINQESSVSIGIIGGTM